MEVSEWTDRVAAKIAWKLVHAVELAESCGFIPYSTENGRWKPNGIRWWTNGFWPATMWQAYRLTGDEMYKREAVRSEELMDEALGSFRTLDHDVGFQWLISSGVDAALTGSERSYDRTLFAAMTLASRFNPNGFIRAWNGSGNEGWAIIDCLMNLPLLYWATRQTGDPRFSLIARRHADTALRCFQREDGSVCHIVCFDPDTGEVLSRPAGQGYASGSVWSRGQAWAVYGFTLSAMLSGQERYLEGAKKAADFLLGEIPEDGLLRCDFRQPASPDVLDNAAQAIAASGLLTLSSMTGDGRYLQGAVRLLTALAPCADWSDSTPAILHKCTTAYHEVSGRHITMNYADYFYIEAVGKLRGEKLLFWAPDMEAGK